MEIISDNPCFYFRIFEDERPTSFKIKGKYHFDIMMPLGFICTDGNYYESFDSCADSLACFCKLMYNRKNDVPYVLNAEDLQLNQKRKKV